MADNYLEKKYEEYLQKKAEYERKKKLGLIKVSRSASSVSNIKKADGR